MDHLNERSQKRRLEQYPGYPTQRFSLALPEQPDSNLDIPLGPWDMNTLPLPLPHEIEQFTAKGLALDTLGRPLHPWAHELLAEENGGTVTGKGAYWHWGPNRTADPIVITNEDRPRILLIERSDTGALALPGGFVDGGEDPHVAAVRELFEETGLTINTAGQLIYNGPVADLRTTLHAWAETSAYLFTIDAAETVAGGDDALSADWYYLDTLPETLFGSHAWLVEKAIEQQRQSTNRTRRVLQAPEHERITKEVHAGHMAYRHYVTTHRDNSIFVKEHDSAQFTDPHREAHSRAYLAKEHHNYQHLQAQGFSALPRHVELVDDTLLAMEHLAPEDGWHWRAPQAHMATYMSEVISALQELGATSPIKNPTYHQRISPTYETFWREGWDTIDNKVATSICEKIAVLTEQWRPEQQRAARALSEQMDTLRNRSTTLDRTPELYPAHNDARQSNIAWHPNYGVRIVDWSWADPAPKNADSTMFLIDMKKSGHTVHEHLHLFNPDYALQLIGFWLAHSIWETRDANMTVREQQIASATAALNLLQQTGTFPGRHSP